MVYEIVVLNWRWRIIPLLAGFTIAEWVTELLPNHWSKWIVFPIHGVIMIGCAKWFRWLLRQSLPVVVGETRSTQ